MYQHTERRKLSWRGLAPQKEDSSLSHTAVLMAKKGTWNSDKRYSNCHHPGVSFSSSVSKIKMSFQSWSLCQRDLARETLCQETGRPICSLTQGCFGGHFIVEWFHNTAFAEAAWPVLMLYRKGLPPPVLTRRTQAYRLRGYSLTSSISDRKTTSVVRNQTVRESLKCFHFAKNPPLWQISPFSSFWPVLSWILQLSSLRVRGLDLLYILTKYTELWFEPLRYYL